MDGLTCVVTGAGSGIGRATALEMTACGAKVAVVDLNREAGIETVASVRERGGEAIFVGCDVSSPQSVEEMVAEVARAFGRIDVLHNNAGIVDTQLTDRLRIDEIPLDVWEKLFAVNVTGPWLCTKAAVPYLKKSASPAIVNCASVSALVAYEGESAYCATKSAVIGLTKSTALDLAPFGIRCNCYCPAAIDTPMISDYVDEEAGVDMAVSGTHLVPRTGRPEEVAKLVCFLASSNASFINGAAYLIDGGSLAWRGTR